MKIAWLDDLNVPELGMLLDASRYTYAEMQELHEWLEAHGGSQHLDMIFLPHEEARTMFELRWT